MQSSCSAAKNSQCPPSCIAPVEITGWAGTIRCLYKILSVGGRVPALICEDVAEAFEGERAGHASGRQDERRRGVSGAVASWIVSGLLRQGGRVVVVSLPIDTNPSGRGPNAAARAAGLLFPAQRPAAPTAVTVKAKYRKKKHDRRYRFGPGRDGDYRREDRGSVREGRDAGIGSGRRGLLRVAHEQKAAASPAQMRRVSSR